MYRWYGCGWNTLNLSSTAAVSMLILYFTEIDFLVLVVTCWGLMTVNDEDSNKAA